MPQEPGPLEKVSQAAPERCGKSWGSSPRFQESFLTRHPLPSPALRHLPVGATGEMCGNVAVLDTKGLR